MVSFLLLLPPCIALLTLSLGEKQQLNLVYPKYSMSSLQGWEDDIRRVFNSDPEKFNPLLARDLGLIWVLDPDTSLRVYVEDHTHTDGMFPFHTVRNLAMILLLYGPKFDTMINCKILEEISFDTGIEWMGPKPLPDIYTDQSQSPNGPTPRELASHLLHNCSTIEDVCETMSDFLSTLKPEFCQRFNVDFSGLLRDPPKKSDESGYTTREATPETTQEYYADKIRQDRGPTIEFIHHPGTLDEDHIIHWIRLISALVEMAGAIGLESLILLLGLNENGYTYTFAPRRSRGEKAKNSDSTESEYSDNETGPSTIYGTTQEEAERNLQTWDFIGWHPTLARHTKKDPPDVSADASFQHNYPIAGLVAAMDVIGTGVDSDTSEFWLSALDVIYGPGGETKPEPELPEVKVKVEEEDQNEREGTEAMDSVANYPLLGGNRSETEWIPDSGSESNSEDDEVWGRKRRRLNR